MNKDIEKVCTEMLLEHLGLKDPLESMEREDVVPNSRTATTTLIRSIVREALDMGSGLGKDDMDKKLVAFAVKDPAIALSRAADALHASAAAMQRKADPGDREQPSPASSQSPPLRQAQVYRPPSREDFWGYYKCLKKFAAVIGSRWEFPFVREHEDESEMTAKVFYVLARRRHALREQRIPTANSNAWKRPADSDADRGDEILALYHTIVDTVELPEEPENWTLRDKPDILENTLDHMMIDVLAVAAASEINFDDVLAKAKKRNARE